MKTIDHTTTLRDHIQSHHDAIVESLINENEETIMASIASMKLVRYVKREVAEFEEAWPVTSKMKLLILGMKR